MSTVDVKDLFPRLAEVRVEDVVVSDSSVWIRAAADAVQAYCPRCGTRSQRVHSRYQRRLRDPAVGGRMTVIELRVRRFFCDNSDCVRTTFVEQIAGLTARHARHSVAARQFLQAVGFALGGRAGQRLTHWLALPTGRMSLLRLIRAAPESAAVTPIVLGVDDFALRRGHVYATILVDLDTHRPIDVLPDRRSETLARWLRDRPGVQIICRDRAGAYAEGARLGAPDAVQVADRWHLWHNLGEAIEATVIRHRSALPEPPPPPDDTVLVSAHAHQTAPEQPIVVPPQEATMAETRMVVRTRERHTAVQQLHAQGQSISSISRSLRLDRHTVRRFARATSVDELLAKTTSRITLLDTFKPHLNQRFNDGHTDAASLYSEIREQGYRGSPQTVRRYLHPFRANRTAPAAAPAVPKIREVVRWLMTKPDNLETDQQQHLEQILARSPHLAAAAQHIRSFATMMNELAGHLLPAWITAVNRDDLPALHSFTAGIQRDLAAVTAGLTLPHSSGPVEGHVNRVKTIKRQMYGRANFDLLRKRILHA